MTNIFQEIESDDNIPSHIKEEMISNLESIKLIADLVDLFFIKGSSSALQALSANPGEADSGQPSPK